MKLSTLVRGTGLCLAIAFAGQANAALIGRFSGAVSKIDPLNNASNGNLAADIAADANSPFDLGTWFSGSFAVNELTADSNPNPNVGMYNSAVQGFSIAGGAINTSSSTGDVEIENDSSHGGQLRDYFRLGGTGIDETFVINGNNWVLKFVHVILNDFGTGASSNYINDNLNQGVSSATPWKWEQVVMSFSLEGLANSRHLVRIGGDLDVEMASFAAAPSAAAVPSPATLPLLIAALGLLGLRRRRVAA